MYKKKQSELAVITKAKDLGSYIFIVTEKSPKKYRFTLVSKMQRLALSVIENILRANFVYIRDGEDIERMEQRKAYQREAYVELKLLGYMAFMAREQLCILPKQYQQISILEAEVNRLLIAWGRSDQNRYKKG